MSDEELIARNPPRVPSARLVWTAIVDIADRIDLGPAPGGHRSMIPIVGGTFQAGPGVEGLNGIVLPGGADRQLVRPDGVKALDALYEMQATDGTIITVRNRVTIDETRRPDRYAMSVISARVRSGPLDWLNRRVLVGTLQLAPPERKAVIIRGWCMDCDAPA